MRSRESASPPSLFTTVVLSGGIIIMSATPSTSLSRKRRSLPSPLSAVITRSPKKRRTVSSVSASSTQKLTGFSEFQLERFLLNLSPYNGSEVITSDEVSRFEYPKYDYSSPYHGKVVA